MIYPEKLLCFTTFSLLECHGDYEMDVTTLLGGTMEGIGQVKWLMLQDNFGDSLLINKIIVSGAVDVPVWWCIYAHTSEPFIDAVSRFYRFQSTGVGWHPLSIVLSFRDSCFLILAVRLLPSGCCSLLKILFKIIFLFYFVVSQRIRAPRDVHSCFLSKSLCSPPNDLKVWIPYFFRSKERQLRYF